MAEAEEEAAPELEMGKKRSRERSTIQFPYVDLDSAVDVAKTMYTENGTAPCTLDQLAPWMKHESVDSGTFRNKVAAARYFGLVAVSRNQVSLAQLGREVVEPQKERSAKVRAFLEVALYKKLFETYRGRMLPPDIGLENEIKSLGVAAKQTDKARQTFRRSAEQAGFFAQGRDRLVMPSNVTLQSGKSEGAPAGEHHIPRGGNAGGAPPTGIHPNIRVLLAALPSAGQVWPVGDQEAWLDVLRGVFAQLYLPEPDPADAEL